jgi:hypothetical protein
MQLGRKTRAGLEDNTCLHHRASHVTDFDGIIFDSVNLVINTSCQTNTRFHDTRFDLYLLITNAATALSAYKHQLL